MTAFIDQEDRWTSGVYGKRDVCFVRGQDMTLWDDQGKSFLDFGSGISVANIGHCHPQLVEAVERQARTLITAPELAYNDQRAKFLEHLGGVTPPGVTRFFLCNSGTEAVEACIKFAHVSTGRKKFVAAMRGFHGRTLGALGATHNKKYREPFGALVPQFEHVPFNRGQKLTAAVDEHTAAVVIEWVQGEGGVRVADSEFVQHARELCDRMGALLIVDEVQTGFARTGRMFASDHFQVKPDLMAMGKAIAGGIPMGAVGISENVVGLGPGVHGSTFGGNALACAAAQANLKIIQDEALADNADEMGQYFVERLKAIDAPAIREIRGCGLMIGVELKCRVAEILHQLLMEGFVVLNAGPTVVRFLPPLTVQKTHIDAVVEAFSRCIFQINPVTVT